MLSDTHFTNLKSARRKKKNRSIRRENYRFHFSKSLKDLVILIGAILFIAFHLISMSVTYQVIGAVRCPKIKKHAGIKLKPINKAKEPFMPSDMLIYSCESAEFTQSIKCLDDGRWSEIPYCPDPSNFTCPDLPTLAHGVSNSSGPPYKVGSVVAFKCDTETFPNLPNLPSTFPTTTPSPTTTANQFNNLTTISETSTDQQQQLLRYNLTGHRLLKCLPTSRWNHPMPSCTPIYKDPPSQFKLVLASAFIILVPILIIIVMAQLFLRWRKRHQQRERWKQYFTDYKYRHSKTSITFGTRPNSNASTAIPVTDL